MKTVGLLLAATCVAVACSDNSQPTAPADGRSLRPSGSASGQLDPSANGKPVDQVGFTKITRVASAPFLVLKYPGQTVGIGNVTVDCPAGSVVVSGGHQFQGSVDFDHLPLIQGSGPHLNGWEVDILNPELAPNVTYVVYALCAS